MDWDNESVFAGAAPEAHQPEPAPTQMFDIGDKRRLGRLPTEGLGPVTRRSQRVAKQAPAPSPSLAVNSQHLLSTTPFAFWPQAKRSPRVSSSASSRAGRMRPIPKKLIGSCGSSARRSARSAMAAVVAPQRYRPPPRLWVFLLLPSSLADGATFSTEGRGDRHPGHRPDPQASRHPAQ